MRILIYLLLCIPFILSGCSGGRRADKEFDEAERIMAVDSIKSWRILKNIDQNDISERQKNRLFLDTLYYKVIYDHRDTLTEKELKLGNSNFSGDFNPGELKWLLIKSFDADLKEKPLERLNYLKDAEVLATKLKRKEELAFAYLFLADYYVKIYNASTVENYAERAVSLFREINYPLHLRNARLKAINTLAIRHEFKAVRDSLEAMKSEVLSNASEDYRNYFMDQTARLFTDKEEAQQSVKIWNEIYGGKNKPSTETLVHWAYAYVLLNELDSAKIKLDEAKKTAHGIEEEQLCLNVEYNIYVASGQLEKLPEIDKKRFIISDSIIRVKKIDDSSLLLNLKYENDTREAWDETNKAKQHTLIAVFVAVIFILVLLILWLFLRKRNKLLKLEHENDILKIRTLQNNLFESDNRNKETNSKISDMLQSRFKLMDNLASTYFECKDTNQEQKRIYNDVKKAVTNFSSKETLQELTDILNAYRNNIMDRFRTEFPSLSASQYRLALYLFCGFSLQSISIFTGSEVKNIYVYKSRLKSVIAKSDSNLKDEFLSYFV